MDMLGYPYFFLSHNQQWAVTDMSGAHEDGQIIWQAWQICYENSGVGRSTGAFFNAERAFPISNA